MEQLTFVGAGELEWREASEPSLEGNGEALVRPLAVATCDLDALIVSGHSPFQPPFAIGHECVAEVVEVGDGVAAVAPGQRVTVPFQISCGQCEPCRRGRTGNCTTVEPHSTYGFGPAVEQVGGFLSDLVRVPYADHMLVPVPDGIEPARVASASDNLPDAWRTVGPPLADEPGGEVLVAGGAGPGSIGLYAAGLAVALGSGRVVYVDRDAGRLAVAERLGAETVDASADGFPKRLGPFPITVDSSADADGLGLAARSTAPDGICTSTGIYFADPPPLPLFEMYLKVNTFRTGRTHALQGIAPVLELVGEGKLAPEEVTSRVVPWSEAPDALAELDWTKLVMERAPA